MIPKSFNFGFGSSLRTRAILGVSVFFIVATLLHFDVLKRFELVTYDYRAHLRAYGGTPNIAIVEISDDSVDAIGRWPWERSWHAALIEALREFGAKTVAFDVVFSESSEPAKDAALSKAIQRAGNVYLAEIIQRGPDGKPRPLVSLPEFTQFAKSTGHINLNADIDGVMRRIALMADVDGERVPQLAFAIALDEYGVPVEQVEIKKDSLWIPAASGAFRVPLDEERRMMIHWEGRWDQAFEHHSYIDVIRAYAAFKKGQGPALNFKDKFVFVGTTATGLFDIRPTPLEPSYPAVGVNLTVLSNLLQKRFISKLSEVQNLLVLALLSIVLFQLLQKRGYLKAAVMTVLIAFGHVAVAAAFFLHSALWINIVYPLILIFATYFVITLHNQISVALERARLLKMATHDSLTGLYNVGHFKLLMRAEMTTIAMRGDRNLSFLMTDIDNFKKVNDTYGHLSGDAVLKEAAAVLKANTRALDVVARYGGEEFIVMLPGASAQEAFQVAEKMRVGLQEKVFPHEKGDFSVTISMGATQMKPGETDADVIVGRADAALYEAKHTGKNKVVIA